MPHAPGSTLKPLVKLPRDPADCWTWLGNTTDAGVPQKQFDGKPMLARRWLWQQLFGPIRDGLVISPSCGNAGCVNPHHLRMTTQADAVRGGVQASLMPDQVRQIKAHPADDRSANVARVFAERFGVSVETIRDIWGGRSWARARQFYGPKQARNQFTREAANG
jgi:hypothetical protein